MSASKNCTCGNEPAMMWVRTGDDSLYFHMKCKVCGRRGKANSDVNLAVEDWNGKQEDGWKNMRTELCVM